MKTHITLITLTLFLGLSCSSPENKSPDKETDTTEDQNIIVKTFTEKENESDDEKFDTQLFKEDNLEQQADLNSRVKFLKADKREIYFYDSYWKQTTQDKAEFISTIKHLKNDLFIIKDYYVTGERQFAGIYRTLTNKIDWSTIYTSDKKQARKVGKMVYWHKIGLIDYIQYYEWTDWEKGHHQSRRMDIAKYQTPGGTDYMIKNTSNLIVDELFIQNGAGEKPFRLPRYFGGIKIVYAPELTFLFRTNAMVINKDTVISSKLPKSIAGSFTATFNTKRTNVENYKRKTDLGWMTLSYTDNSCEESDFNSFLLVTDGEILIEGLLNTELFLTDSDGDGNDEIYIFSYRSCENSLKVIRIKK